MEQTECSETSAYKIQTPGNNPEESTQKFRTGRKFEIKKWFIFVMSEIQDECSWRTGSLNKTNSFFCLWFIDRAAIIHTMW